MVHESYEELIGKAAAGLLVDLVAIYERGDMAAFIHGSRCAGEHCGLSFVTSTFGDDCFTHD